MLQNYFTWSNPLAIAHATVGLVAIVTFVFWHRNVRGMKRSTASARLISELEYRRHVQRVEKFDTFFDFLASTFILIGLTGTIIGFVGAVPSLRDPDYDFRDFTSSLSVSAMGIVWSIALYAFLALYRMTFLAAAIEELHSRQDQRDLAKLLANSLNELSTRISEKLGASLEHFVTAANGMEAASRELAAKAGDAGDLFTTASEDAKRSVEAALRVCAEVRELPAAAFDLTKQALHDHTKDMAALFEQERQNLSRTTEFSRDAMEKQFGEMHQRYVQQLDRDVKAASTATENAVNTIGKWAAAFSVALGDAQKEVPAQIHKAHQDALKKVAATAQTLERAGEGHVEVIKGLDASVRALDQAMAAFAAATRTLPATLMQLERTQMSAVERKLDLMASALRAGEKPWAARRRWWQFRPWGTA